jgi:hypothetical protein
MFIVMGSVTKSRYNSYPNFLLIMQITEVNALNFIDTDCTLLFSHFTYPPPTIAMGEQVEEARAKELQIAALEKQQILEFESYLAAASTKQTITEQTSLLLTQVRNISSCKHITVFFLNNFTSNII